MARSRRRNGEDLGVGWRQGVASLPARPRGPKIEAISASPQLSGRGDLTDFVHCFVSKSGHIDIFLRLVSSHLTKSLKTSIVHIVGPDRSEESRVGKECVSTCRSRWSPYPYTTKTVS